MQHNLASRIVRECRDDAFRELEQAVEDYWRRVPWFGRLSNQRADPDPITNCWMD